MYNFLFHKPTNLKIIFGSLKMSYIQLLLSKYLPYDKFVNPQFKHAELFFSLYYKNRSTNIKTCSQSLSLYSQLILIYYWHLINSF